MKKILAVLFIFVGSLLIAEKGSAAASNQIDSSKGFRIDQVKEKKKSIKVKKNPKKKGVKVEKKKSKK